MNATELSERLWHGEDVMAGLLRLLLRPLSWLYLGVVTLRRRLYNTGILPRARADVPVVSVGNIAVGGTGKTPLVIWLVDGLRERALQPVVVSRGYKSESSEPVAVTASAPSGTEALSAGADEAVMVARRTGCPVVTSPDRAAACRLATSNFSPDVIVLDDGFQHLSLERDLDIVVLGGEEREAAALPAGPLREGRSALAGADILVEGEPREPACADEDGRPRVRMTCRPGALVESVAAAAPCAPLSELAGQRVLAVAGIARPRRFLAALRECGAEVVGSMLFRDHHGYTEEDWQRICIRAREAERVVTTEKDLVKLERFNPEPGLLVAIRLEVEVEGGDALFERIGGLTRNPANRIIAARETGIDVDGIS